jgi:hypothetical protein
MARKERKTDSIMRGIQGTFSIFLSTVEFNTAITPSKRGDYRSYLILTIAKPMT